MWNGGKCKSFSAACKWNDMHVGILGNGIEIIEIAATTSRSIKGTRATIRTIAIQLEQWYEL